MCDGIDEGGQSDIFDSSHEILRELAPHPYHALDAEGKIIEVNGAWLDALGYTRSEVIGEPFRSFLHRQSVEPFEQRFQQFKAEGKISDVRLQLMHTEGHVLEVAFDGRAEYDDDGEFLRTHCQFTDITELLDWERQRNTYRQAIESSTELIAAADTDFKLRFANPRYREFHGLPLEESLEGRSVPELLGDERFEEAKPYIERALDGESVSYEMTRLDATGNERVLNIEYYPLESGTGAIVGAVASMRDVTNERNRIAALKQLSEYRRLLSVVNHRLVRAESPTEILPEVTDAISSSDLFGCTFFALVEDTAPDFVCTSETGLTERDVEAFHTPEYLDAVFEQDVLRIEDVTEPPFRQHVEDRPSHSGVALAVTHDGHQYGVLTVHLPPDGDLDEVEYRLLDLLVDDLGLFLHSHSVEQNYRTFEEIAERISDPIMLQNLEGEFAVINTAVSEYANLPTDELLGRDEFVFMDAGTAERIRDRKREVLETEAPVRYEVSPRLPTKGKREFSTIRYPHYDESGELDGTVAICRDVTELKEREQQIRVMDRVLRHNVNNDMTVIEGFAETIRDIGVDDRTVDHAERIIHHSRRLTNIVEKERKITALLSNPPEPRPIDLVRTAKSAIRTIETDYPDIDVEVDAPEQCFVEGSEELGQAIEELLTNAVVHSDRAPPSIQVHIESDGETATISVIDDGPVIPEMERKVLTGEKAIEPLYHGSGLGLWLVNLTIKRLNGTLDFDRNEPRGNIVRICLPTLS